MTKRHGESKIPGMIIIATQNEYKYREFRALLAPFDLSPLYGRVEMPAEDGHSFTEIAAVKARYVNTLMLQPAIGDDSGLCVVSLRGAPGIRSARFAGLDATDEENVAHLLHAMEGVTDRRAHMTCALAYVDGVRERVFVGKVHGRITTEPRGSNGFGYDSVFEPIGRSSHRMRTFAEMEDGEKQSMSHRARAAYQLKVWLAS